MENQLDIKIVPGSDAYDPNDYRWIQQVNELLELCQREVGDVRKEETSVEGKKGGFADIVIALGSAGVFTAAVNVFKAWLSRDQTRSLAIEFHDGGKLQKIEVSGKNFSQEMLDKYMQLALEAYKLKNE